MDAPAISATTTVIHLPERICGDVDAALQREWLVTNGLGGFAFGTVAGALTRRYHGLLIAALQPPLGRTLMLSKMDETVEVDAHRVPLFANIWPTGVERPNGCAVMRRFDLIDGVPTWRFELAGRTLIKRVWMEYGQNTTYVEYSLNSGPEIVLALRCLANWRDYHSLTPGDNRRMDVRAMADGLIVHAPGATHNLSLRSFTSHDQPERLQWTPEHNWYRAFQLPFEKSVGYDHAEDHLCVGVCRVALDADESITLAAAANQPGGTGPEREFVEGAEARRRSLLDKRLTTWQSCAGVALADAPVAARQLVLAADQFIVARPTPESADGKTLIAGYPWFTDWGRDTMIALPGLTLATGRFDIARQILRTWARYVDRGMIPNRFPDAGATPEYNTADATLWYLWAIDQYFRATGDVQTVQQLFPVIREIIAEHCRGTRYQIRVDDDGLIIAGEPGVQLTWMDAKVGERVITPRIGKPIELSALWYDGLENVSRLARRIGEPRAAAEYDRLARQTRESFEKFWNPGSQYCYDVIGGPHGADARIQANAIFAVSLTNSPLTREQQQAVVATASRELLAWFGLRTLAPHEARYHGRYDGQLVERDEAYHQGTAWGWLLGPFVQAHLRVHRDPAAARALLEPLLGQLWTHCVGSLAEIFDGDEPHSPRGCVAQAWSVAETLRAWSLIHGGSGSA